MFLEFCLNHFKRIRAPQLKLVVLTRQRPSSVLCTNMVETFLLFSLVSIVYTSKLNVYTESFNVRENLMCLYVLSVRVDSTISWSFLFIPEMCNVISFLINLIGVDNTMCFCSLMSFHAATSKKVSITDEICAGEYLMYFSLCLLNWALLYLS